MMTLGASSWACLVGVLGAPVVFGGAKLPRECCDGKNEEPPAVIVFGIPWEEAFIELP